MMDEFSALGFQIVRKSDLNEAEKINSALAFCLFYWSVDVVCLLNSAFI